MLKNGCEFAREASPLTLGKAAGIPLPAVREQKPAPPPHTGESSLPQESSSFCWNESGEGISWVPLFLQTRDRVTLLLEVEGVWEEQLSIRSGNSSAPSWEAGVHTQRWPDELIALDILSFLECSCLS